ncbi:hypothetical protein VPDG_00023 [Vibrio phage henriette 12B8]|uniref:hypothetical protein n=1 Tax=Vibrio phage henriette 12B8 TaxID=573174 RepID=UPI0002C0BF39|nr:hypothetical protein VPDG_00023 [Vibrio phage henriette 12B8]AGG58185.1 hypothetical protein VPDG_00023 [Vibrio phage henriette 12B8]
MQITKKELIHKISAQFGVNVEYIELFKFEGTYHIGGKFGAILPSIDLGVRTLCDGHVPFFESLKYILMDNEIPNFNIHIQNIDWNVE